MVLNFRKPKAGEFVITRLIDGRTFAELGTQVLRDFLTSHPGATKDRIYDELVSRMVQAGKMEAHDFNALLRSVAEEVQEPIRENLFDYKEPDLFGSHVHSRWYLKETADQVDQAEQAKEDEAAGRLSEFIGDYLKKKPELEGVHFSNLIEKSTSFLKSAEPGGRSRTGCRNTSSRLPAAHGDCRIRRKPSNSQRSVSRAPYGASSGSPTP